MRTKRAIGVAAVLAALGAATIVSNAQARLRNVPLRPESKLWFDGTSTVRSFSCAAARLDASVETNPGAAAAAIVQSATLTVPVASIDCRNGQMNGHMKKALKADHHAAITWSMTGYRIDADSVLIDGRLTIAGRENPVQLRAAGSLENGVLRVRGSHQLRMTEFGVQPPRLMLGALRVHDAVTVKFDVALNP